MSTEALLDILWILLCAGFVFLMQGGFLCLESGITRSKNSINVAFKNIVDFGLAVLLYWMVSYGLMFGSSAAGWVGTDGFFYTILGDEAPFQYSVFIFQAMFCATGATIISGATAERLPFYVYLFITGVFSILVYPFVGHWVWATDFLGEASGWLAQKGFLDFAGSSVVHSTGGWVSLALLLLVGPRVGRFDENGKPVEIPGSNMPLAMLGTVLLIFGWFGFNGGSTLSFGANVPLILMNTLLGAVAGMTFVLALIPFTKKLPDPGLVMNGALAGLVGVTANCNLTGPVAAVIIGGVAGAIMIGTIKLLERLKIDDAVGAIPVHLTPGIWGTLAVALFADAGIMGVDSVDRVGMFETQFIGVIVIGFWSFTLPFLFFFFLKKVMPLRVSEEEEHAGLNISEHGARTETLFLLEDMERHAQTGDLSKRVRVEPFTEVGQIARQYNKVIDSLDMTMNRLKSIFQDLHDGIITFTSDGSLLSMNSAAAKFYGLTPAGALGVSAWDLLVPETRDDLEVHQNAESEPFDPFRAGVLQELHYVRKNSRKDEVVEFVSSKGEFNDEVIYTGLIRDVSETVQTKRSKNRMLNKLAGAQQSQFYAGMCKQSLPTLRNLADRIQDLAKVLPRVLPDPRLKVLESDAQQIIEITNDLEHIDEQGALPVRGMNLSDFIQEFYNELIAEKRFPEVDHTEVALDLSDSSLYAEFAPNALEQILEDLFVLSSREAEPGSTTLLKTEPIYLDRPMEGTEVIPAGEYFTIQFINNGPGIPEEELDTFYDGRNRKYPDIDLVLTESMVRHMQGVLDVDTAPGEGITLTVYLPIARKISDPGSPEQPTGTVLFVDDHKLMQNVVSDVLHRAGFDVIVTDTVEKAINRMKESKTDLVLLDLVLAKDVQAREYGYRKIQEAYPDMPVLVTAGEVDAEVLSNIIQSGGAGFVEKPFNSAKLVRLIKREMISISSDEE